MKKSEIPIDQMDAARSKLEAMEKSFGIRVRTNVHAGPATQAYNNANGNAAFQPQILPLYGVVVAS